MSVMGNVTTLPVGPAPTLDLDFVAQRFSVNGKEQNYADLISHTRASSATYFDRGGVMRLAAPNQPRFDYDPVTGAYRGLLIEEQRTNTFTNSANLALMNLNAGATWEEAPLMAPDGQLAARVLKMNGPASSGVYRTNASANAGQQVWSVSARAITGNGLLRLQLSGTSYAATYYVDFDLINNKIVRSSGATGFINKLSEDGTYRLALTSPVDNPATPGHNVCVYAGDTTAKSFAVWGGQLEAGTFPTSYIPTTTAAATRAGPVILQKDTSWFRSEGTLYAEFVSNGIGIGNTSAAVYFCTAGNPSSNVIVIRNGTTAGDINAVFSSGSMKGRSGAQFGNIVRTCLALRDKDMAFAVDGGTVVTSSAIGMAAPSYFGLGFAVSMQQWLNGYLRRVLFVPSRLINSRLQEITR